MAADLNTRVMVSGGGSFLPDRNVRDQAGALYPAHFADRFQLGVLAAVDLHTHFALEIGFRTTRRIVEQKYSSLIVREFREGHEIGNHTWTHPDISNIRGRYLRFELNVTERFFAAKLGISNNEFVRTTQPRHKAVVSAMLARIVITALALSSFTYPGW